jgi:hypothetical protein
VKETGSTVLQGVVSFGCAFIRAKVLTSVAVGELAPFVRAKAASPFRRHLLQKSRSSIHISCTPSPVCNEDYA